MTISELSLFEYNDKMSLSGKTTMHIPKRNRIVETGVSLPLMIFNIHCLYWLLSSFILVLLFLCLCNYWQSHFILSGPYKCYYFIDMDDRSCLINICHWTIYNGNILYLDTVLGAYETSLQHKHIVQNLCFLSLITLQPCIIYYTCISQTHKSRQTRNYMRHYFPNLCFVLCLDILINVIFKNKTLSPLILQKRLLDDSEIFPFLFFLFGSCNT